MTLAKKTFILLSIIGSIAVMGCNHLLYYPTKTQYVNPTKIKSPPKEITVKMKTGEKVHGWLFKAINSTKPNLDRPIILFFHGNAQNLTSHFLNLYWILEEGYDFLIFDYPGYGASEGSPTQSNTVKSGHIFYNWLKKNKYRNIIIFGQSLGGSIALQVSQQLVPDDDLCLVVVESTFASYQSVANSVLAQNWITWPFQWLAYLLFSDDEAPKKNISKISPVPLVVIHGTEDRIVPYELGQVIFSKAISPKEFWTVNEGKHMDTFFSKKHGQSFRQKLIKRIDTYCRY